MTTVSFGSSEQASGSAAADATASADRKPAATTVVIIAASDSVRVGVERVAVAMGLTVFVADAAAEAIAHLNEGSRDSLCVLELGTQSTGVVQAVRSQYPGIPIIGVSSPESPEATTEGLRAGLFDAVPYPIHAPDLASLISNARDHLAFVAAQRQTSLVEVHSYGVFGTSAVMREVLTLVQRAAPSRCGVIVCGERGTGREMVARAIHAYGARQAPFVKVDCATPSPQDLEHELFGQAAPRRGRAETRRRSLEQMTPAARLCEANGGTLFLENLVNMPDRVQARLVRVLRDREALVSDQHAPLEVDVRPIASVGATVNVAVAEGGLREDLFERLSVVRIDLPALRHRREDIPVLALHFLKEICRANGSPIKTLSRSALALLGALPWRGNARELRALLERLVLLVPQSVIRIEDVLAHVRLDNTAAAIRPGATLREARAQFEREYIRAALQQHHGRMGEAAASLGIERTNLYRKVRSLKLTVQNGARRP